MTKNEIEALLFSAGKNMNVDQMAELVGVEKKEVLESLQQLKQEYEQKQGALMIMDEGEEWKIHVREQYLPLVRKIVADTELPKTVLETLSIIAYRSPVLQSEVIDARGSLAYEHITLLAEMGFVTKEKMGRSYKLKITEKFFEYFDVEGDKDLREMFKDAKKPEVKEKDVEKMSEELYKLKHHKSHGEVVDVPSGTSDPERHQTAEHEEPPKEEQETQEEKDETDDVLEKVKEEMKEIEHHRTEPDETREDVDKEEAAEEHDESKVS